MFLDKGLSYSAPVSATKAKDQRETSYRRFVLVGEWDVIWLGCTSWHGSKSWQFRDQQERTE
jgi:hypothetical protein